ncbi:cystinosin [Anaeramoeba flamelloides]|uniref:Cystinosin n=1 Tax=Anaeramoeba flamelloides TaxID=1746091 RepID=A0AAV7YF83_9EUKA|nr:cystinosin [Anaeramoeba flamelloides]|eukprot:Anaeramoba_flamelloidesa327203_35.p1 GENE.a327203_35~~a327203_35.p1  ORF type:complete len:322 (-),score=66.65 a327203_35:55-1020(-)
MVSHAEETVSLIIGFMYTIAWSLSFYPQAIENWQRKRVDGLSFEFLGFNLTGFTCYTVFNCVLFWSKYVKNEYFEEHPGSPSPVRVNDVVFAIHALILTLIQIIQCIIYPKGKQTWHWIAKVITGIMWVSIPIAIIVASSSKAVTWLDFLNFLGYIKLTLTIFKYIPQAWMNYKRKSTVGWSIENIILDFTGGTLSILQMIMDSWAKHDWSLFELGNLPKVALGMLSISFDILFMIQHYCLYTKRCDDRVITLWGIITRKHKFDKQEKGKSDMEIAHDEKQALLNSEKKDEVNGSEKSRSSSESESDLSEDLENITNQNQD